MENNRDRYKKPIIEPEGGNENMQDALACNEGNHIISVSPKSTRIYNGKFKKLKKLGFGSYGTVYLVTNQESKLFAMKKYFYDSAKGDNLQYIVSMTDLVNSIGFHSSLPSFYDCFKDNFNYYLVQDYYPFPLIDIIKQYPYSSADKCTKDFLHSIMFLLADAVNFLHSHNILHRDLKPDNIMISLKGEVKILDFDLSTRIHSEKDKLSTKVGTLNYKPPELLFGELCYGFSLDLWALGCIFAELYLGYPIFDSRNEIELLCKITEVLGAPSEKNYEGVTKLESYMSFNNPEQILFDSLFAQCPENLKELISNILSLDPQKRLNADKILRSSLFDGFSKESCLSCINSYLSERLI